MSSTETSATSESEGGIAPAEHESIESLVEGLTSRVGVPLDYFAVTATLEATGLRDVDAQERFGYENLFALSKDLHALVMSDPPETVALEATETKEGESRAKRVFKHLLEGSFFAMPMIGQIICILTTRYSLWASLDLSELQATLIGLATVASFAITGGVVMAIGRQGTVLRGMKAYSLLERLGRQLVGLGLLLACLVWLAALLTNLFVPFLDAGGFATVSFYYLALCGMWLSLGLLYMLGKHSWSFGITLGCGLLVSVQVRWLGLGVEWSQLTSIVVATVGSFAVAFRTVRKLQKDENPLYKAAPLPPPDVTAGTLAPFAVYGLGYFTFLFSDRLFAWTSPGRALPMPIWFHTPYELGMDWALLSLLVPMAYLEHVINEFAPRILREQDTLTYDQVGQHRSSMVGFGVRSLGVLLLLSVSSVVATYYGVQALRAFDDVQEIRDFFTSSTTESVFWLAAAGYQLLTEALMVGLLYFTLARGEVVVRAMWQCLFVGTVISFVASRLVAPHWAVVGFVVGAGFFAVRMLREGLNLGQRIDHLYYSAY